LALTQEGSEFVGNNSLGRWGKRKKLIKGRRTKVEKVLEKVLDVIVMMNMIGRRDRETCEEGESKGSKWVENQWR
jgi:hypothetical protein